MRRERFGDLDVHVTGGTDGRGGGTGPVVVILHGFGAPGDDLVPLWQVIDAPGTTRFVFPVAPLALPMGMFGEGRAWWMLDMERLNRDVAAGRFRDLSGDVPEGLSEARGHLLAMLDEMERKLEAPPQRTILGGFSQGAMLACDTVLRNDRPFAGLVLLSGTLLAKDEWLPLMPTRKALPVLQSHGSQDPLLPHQLAEELRDHLTQAGLIVDWISFQGGHEIPPIVLQRLGHFLHRTLG